MGDPEQDTAPGDFPTRVLRIGRRYLVPIPIPAILKLLGVE